MDIAEVEAVLRAGAAYAQKKGIELLSGRFLRIDGNPPGCCIIGAVVLNQQWNPDNTCVKQAARHFGLDEVEVWAIVHGWDTPKSDLPDEGLRRKWFELGAKLRREFTTVQ